MKSASNKFAYSVNLDKILSGLKRLTPREHEVLSGIILGRLNKEIAFELGITIRNRQGAPRARDGENGSQFSLLNWSR